MYFGFLVHSMVRGEDHRPRIDVEECASIPGGRGHQLWCWDISRLQVCSRAGHRQKQKQLHFKLKRHNLKVQVQVNLGHCSRQCSSGSCSGFGPISGHDGPAASGQPAHSSIDCQPTSKLMSQICNSDANQFKMSLTCLQSSS